MDGLRGLLTLLIAFFHVNIWHSVFDAYWLRNFWPILSFFFVLSGFLLTMLYGQRLKDGKTAADFALRRASRLWPMHLFTLGFLVCWELTRAIRAVVLGRADIVAFGEGKSIWDLLTNIFLAHGWGLWNDLSWNVPSWTLSTELLAYAIFVAITLGIKRFDARIMVASGIVVVSAVAFAYQTQLVNWSSVRVFWCLQGFFLGNLLYWVWQRWPIRSRLLGSAVEIGCVVACMLMLIGGVRGLEVYLWWLCMAGLLYAVASESGVLSSVLVRKPLPWLGEISLSVYLMHFPIIIVLNQVLRTLERSGALADVYLPNPYGGQPLISFGLWWLMDALTIAYLAVVVGLSALTYKYIEVPSRDYFSRIAGRIGRGEIGWPKVAWRRTLRSQ
jgi:peptidoglycan/LPS O-acetylase OafA/YrhL